jgi:hypothetical protein
MCSESGREWADFDFKAMRYPARIKSGNRGTVVQGRAGASRMHP